MHEMHDVPKQTVWSSRGDLALGAGTRIRIFPGCHDDEPPLEPWELEEAIEKSLEKENDGPSQENINRSQSRKPSNDKQMWRQARMDSRGSSVRGSPIPDSRAFEGRIYSPASGRRRLPSRSAGDTEQRGVSSEALPTMIDEPNINRLQPDKTQWADPSRDTSRGRRRSAVPLIPSVIETDISIIMKSRLLQGYGLCSVRQKVVF